MKQFVDGDEIKFPVHPTALRTIVPFIKEKAFEKWTVSPTASRSVIHTTPTFTIKMPTEYPHGLNKAKDLGKDDLRKSVRVSRDRARHITQVNNAGGGDPNVVIMRDVLSIRDKETNNGIVARDVSDMKQDHFYLPAFSIPYVGKEIAARHGEDFVDFWIKHDAEAFGRAKALVLTHYGLWFTTPNTFEFSHRDTSGTKAQASRAVSKQTKRCWWQVETFEES